MTRLMYDSTNPFDIPIDAEMVGGYIDGLFKWSADGWARFSRAVRIHIAVFATTNAGHLLDVERGDATPEEAPGWVLRRRAGGAIPGIYCNLATWSAVKAAFDAQNVVQPLYVIAEWDNKPVLIDGAIGKQYADSVLTGKHYDLSIVSDYWPGVDMTSPVDANLEGFVWIGGASTRAAAPGSMPTGVDASSVFGRVVNTQGDVAKVLVAIAALDAKVSKLQESIDALSTHGVLTLNVSGTLEATSV